MAKASKLCEVLPTRESGGAGVRDVHHHLACAAIRAMTKLRSIQSLRAIAALGVVICHTQAFPVGAAGVDLFFVISGFVLAPAMERSSAAKFAFDRFWRIYPLYWIFSFPWLIAAVLIGQATIQRTMANVTLWPIYGAFATPYLRISWTLMFEVLFYAGMAVAIGTRKRWWIVSGFAVCLVLNQLWPQPLLGYLGFPLTLEFLAGAVISKMKTNEAVGALALIAGSIALAAAPAAIFYHWDVGTADRTALFRALYWGLPAALIVYGAVSLERFFGRSLTPLVFLGDASYSIYLVHPSVHALVGAPFFYIPAAISFGTAVHLSIERPIVASKRSVKGLIERYTARDQALTG